MWLADLIQDLRFGCRMLLRTPGFSSLAVLCLTLGIGANAAVFSWIEGVLLRPYPLVVDQDRLFAVTGTDRGGSGHTACRGRIGSTWSANSTLVEAFIAEKITGTTLNVGDRAERAPGSMVSANYFDALGVHPILGRGFEPGEEAAATRIRSTVISYQMWQERFHGDPAIIGKTQMLNGLAAHNRRRRTQRVLRHVRRLRISVLGAGLDAAAVRPRRLQARGSRRAVDRRLSSGSSLA